MDQGTLLAGIGAVVRGAFIGDSPYTTGIKTNREGRLDGGVVAEFTYGRHCENETFEVLPASKVVLMTHASASAGASANFHVRTTYEQQRCSTV
jgi:hypothetical protein